MAESQSSTILSPIEVQNVESHTDPQMHSPSSTLSNEPIKLDIEHAVVEDDPRIWSNTKKVSPSILICK
jgi:hypothetical protein